MGILAGTGILWIHLVASDTGMAPRGGATARRFRRRHTVIRETPVGSATGTAQAGHRTPCRTCRKRSRLPKCPRGMRRLTHNSRGRRWRGSTWGQGGTRTRAAPARQTSAVELEHGRRRRDQRRRVGWRHDTTPRLPPRHQGTKLPENLRALGVLVSWWLRIASSTPVDHGRCIRPGRVPARVWCRRPDRRPATALGLSLADAVALEFRAVAHCGGDLRVLARVVRRS